MDSSIVITGLGLVTPLGIGVEETWNGFLRGASGIREIDLFDSRRYPSSTGGLVDREALHRRFEPQEVVRHESATLMLLTAAEEAFRRAGLEPRDLDRIERSSLLLGSTLGGMPAATAYIREGNERGIGRARGSLLREMLAQTQAHELCDRWGLRGESLILSDACTSGTNSLGTALRLLRRRDADLAVAGGYDPMSEFSFAGFHSLQAVSPEHCRPFDRDRRGLLLGEGAAIFLLEREEEARKRGAEILGRLVGYGTSADAHHITRPDPTARGAVLALRRALDDARIDPAEIGHINAHGTGTPSNDVMEAAAIREVFGEAARNLPVTSNKAAIGHTLGAAGSIEAAVTLLSLRDQVVPPTLNHETLDPACAGIDVVARETRPRRMRAAVSNSFGFGGSNAALVIALP